MIPNINYSQKSSGKKIKNSKEILTKIKKYKKYKKKKENTTQKENDNIISFKAVSLYFIKKTKLCKSQRIKN